MLVTGVTIIEKSTVIESSNCAHDNGELIQMNTTGSTAFVIGGTTCNSIFYLTVNSPIK